MGWYVVDRFGKKTKGPYERRRDAQAWIRWDDDTLVWEADEKKDSTSNSDDDSSYGDGSNDAWFMKAIGIIILFLCLRSCYLDREYVETTRYDNGNIKSEQTYKNRKLNGVSKFYFNDSTKKIEKIQMYKDGKLNGTCKSYYPNGVIEKEIEYKNNKKNGMSKIYYSSGLLHSEATMKNDKLDGISILYDDKGRIVRKETFSNGKSLNIIE